MEKSCNLETGMIVKIQRSNGDIHDASVKFINNEQGVVIVEWKDSNEMKGKEITFVDLLNLNPGLIFDNEKENFIKTNEADLLSKQNSKQYSLRRQTMIPALKVSHARVKQSNEEQDERKSNEDDLKRQSSRGETRKYTRSTVAGAQFSTKSIQESVDSGKKRCETGARSRLTISGTAIDYTKMKKQADENDTGSNVAAVADSNRIVVAKRKRKQDDIENGADLCKDVKTLKIDYSEKHDGDNVYEQMITELRQQYVYSPLTFSDCVSSNRIVVCLRKRPLSNQEIKRKQIDVVSAYSKHSCIVHAPKVKVDLTKYLDNHKFKFDHVFDENADNRLVYHFSVKPLVNAVLSGCNAMCFAFGSTGSGKTFTMSGNQSQKSDEYCHGIYFLSASEIFNTLSSRPLNDTNITCSFFEIYCGKVYDLLNKKKVLRVLEDKNGIVHVIEMKQVKVNTTADVLKLLNTGMILRSQGITSANSCSSRSHAVFQITVSNCKTKENHTLSLVDLAGCERGKDTQQSDAMTRIEGSHINKSLLALKECIRALGRTGSKHVPFRGSVLTKILRDSFIQENSKICMIAMISPSIGDVENSLNTLKYAQRLMEHMTADESISDMEKSNNENLCVNEAESSLQMHFDEIVEKWPHWLKQLQGAAYYKNKNSMTDVCSLTQMESTIVECMQCLEDFRDALLSHLEWLKKSKS